MLSEVRQTVNVNAYSVINGTNVVYMTAAIRTGGEYSVNKTIVDDAVYRANKQECRADYSDFEDMVDEIAEKVLAEDESEN